MAYPGDPSGPAAKGPGAFAGGRLTPDDARPARGGVPAVLGARRRAVRGSRHHVARGPARPSGRRGTACRRPRGRAGSRPRPCVNGAHAPPGDRRRRHEPEDSVDHRPQHHGARRRAGASTAAGVAELVAAATPAGRPGRPRSPSRPRRRRDRLAQTRHRRGRSRRQVARPAGEHRIVRRAGASGDRRSPCGSGSAAGAVVLVAVGIWAASGGVSEAPRAASRPPARRQCRPRFRHSASAPGDDPGAAGRAAAEAVAVTALPQVPPPVVTPPSSRPSSTPVAAAAAPPAPAPRPVVAPTPKPAPRAKPGQRDHRPRRAVLKRALHSTAGAVRILLPPSATNENTPRRRRLASCPRSGRGRHPARAQTAADDPTTDDGARPLQGGRRASTTRASSSRRAPRSSRRMR